MKYTEQHPGYKPKEFIYGFLGKNFPTRRLLYTDDSTIEENKQKLAEETGFSPDSFSFLKQMHSNKCHIAKNIKFALKSHQGDAAATNTKGIMLTVHTADCMPVLFFDRVKKNIAIAHAGWQGALKGIIQNTVESMKKLGSVVENIEIVIGPCIKQQSYEVGPEFYEQFISKDIEYKKFFAKSRKDKHYMFNLPQFVISILNNIGIAKIFYLDQDTYNSKNWFSYREDTHKNNKNRSGHIISFIGIK